MAMPEALQVEVTNCGARLSCIGLAWQEAPLARLHLKGFQGARIGNSGFWGRVPSACARTVAADVEVGGVLVARQEAPLAQLRLAPAAQQATRKSTPGAGEADRARHLRCRAPRLSRTGPHQTVSGIGGVSEPQQRSQEFLGFREIIT